MSDQMGQWNGQGNYGGAPSSGWWTPDEQVGGSQQYQGAPGQPYQSGYQAPGAAQQPYQPYQQPIQGAYPQPMPVSAAVGAARRENVALGLLGAFLGSLVGVAPIVVLGRLGIVAGISGLVMSLVALKGYEKFAGGISKLGVVLTCLIIAVMVFAADWLNWAIVATGKLDIDVFVALEILPGLFELGVIDPAEYGKSLGMFYFFAASGAAPVIIDCFKNRRA